MRLFAYLDPGTGSLIIQAGIGIVAAAGFYFRNTISKVFRKLKGGDKSTSTETKKTKENE